MTGIYFKKILPDVPSKLSSGNSVSLKLENYWGENTLDDLTKLVGLFGVSGECLHLAKAGILSLFSGFVPPRMLSVKYLLKPFID